MAGKKQKVLIFGKDTWPYTTAAREDYAQRKVAFDYINVKQDPADLTRMLEYTKGGREVPVIVENGKVTIGFGGTWGVWLGPAVGRLFLRGPDSAVPLPAVRAMASFAISDPHRARVYRTILAAAAAYNLAFGL